MFKVVIFLAIVAVLVGAVVWAALRFKKQHTENREWWTMAEVCRKFDLTINEIMQLGQGLEISVIIGKNSKMYMHQDDVTKLLVHLHDEDLPLEET